MGQIKVVKLSEAPPEAGSGGRAVRILLDENVGSTRIQVKCGELPPGFDSGGNVREHEEIFFYLSGEPTVEIIGGESLTLAPNTLIFIPPGVKHRHLNHGKEPVRQLFIHASTNKP